MTWYRMPDGWPETSSEDGIYVTRSCLSQNPDVGQPFGDDIQPGLRREPLTIASRRIVPEISKTPDHIEAHTPNDMKTFVPQESGRKDHP